MSKLNRKHQPINGCCFELFSRVQNSIVIGSVHSYSFLIKYKCSRFSEFHSNKESVCINFKSIVQIPKSWVLILPFLRRISSRPGINLPYNRPSSISSYILTRLRGFRVKNLIFSLNRPRSIYQYLSMALRLSRQNYKFFTFSLSLNSQKRLRYKENNTKYRGLTWTPRSHVRILIHRTWPIPKTDLGTKKTPPNMDVCRESLGAMLKYWYKERGNLEIICGLVEIAFFIKYLFYIFGGETCS